MGPRVVGISAFYHNSACCLMENGRLSCAAEEERFSRIKHDAGLPWRSFRFCLERSGMRIHDIDCLAYYESPAKKLGRQLWMYLQPGSEDLGREHILESLDVHRVEREIREGLGYEGRIEYMEHHLSHAASAYFFSGFPQAAVFTADGVGEWDTTTFGRAEGDRMEIFRSNPFPHSIGLLYGTITAYLGFKVNSGEYKVMGLAPYGAPRYVDRMRRLIKRSEKGDFELDMAYFDFPGAKRMASDLLEDLLGGPPRAPETEIQPFHRDVARSLQFLLEELLLEKIRYLHEEVPCDHLCMAGGVALNCVANARILKDGPFRSLFVQPAAGDSGGALGAAVLASNALLQGSAPRRKRLSNACLGPSFDPDAILRWIRSTGVPFRSFRDRTDELLQAVVDRLVEGKVVAWLHGRMEFGPRALGARSILADPRRPDMRDKINGLVKKREEFRPFAPSVLAERAGEHFRMDHPSPFMLETCQVISPIPLPAVTHVDGSARIQTVHEEDSPRYAALLRAFEERTGCPVLLNTSFNMRGEPIVHTPEDALRCFIRARMDTLVLEDLIIDQEDIPPFWRMFLQFDPREPQPATSHTVYTLL